MTDKDIWDFVMSCYQTGNYAYSGLCKKSSLRIFENNDNYFRCGFYHLGNLIHFKIKISYILTNLWSDNTETHSYDIESWITYAECGGNSLHTLPINELKKLLKPVIREIKLNSIGI